MNQLENGSNGAKLQPSKKGRKAWRKNIDIEEIEEGLEERRQELIAEGKPIDEIESSELFYIDEEADDKIGKKVESKKLKSTEILDRRSKVPGLVHEQAESRKKKVEGISKKEIHKLMKLAGRVQGVSRSDARIAKDGLLNSKTYDLWNEEEPNQKKRKRELPEILKKYSGNSYTHATKMPKTMRMKPVKIQEMEKIPHEGKSYNPLFSSWKDLIEEEYFKEKSKEDKREELERERERIQYMIDNFDDEGEVEGGDEVDEQGEEAEEDKYKLSVNAVTENKIKSKSKRNREKRNKEKNRLLEEIKSLKNVIRQIEELPEIIEKEEQRTENKGKDKKVRKLGSKYEIREGGLEVKLSDELGDSLRKLKPEGDLIEEQMIKLQASGKVEVRKEVSRKKEKVRVSEKWGYKDFR
ncbi:DEKNAAC104097 [Brettanomyces naardenensis]|uniref:Ribosome biogenesis protein NOP53 n=1 Tax=Brettanomyces naardenensis TaxID=13370 RepID=A0A448YQM8_BRENA|nr:DEKNAAC104097 [Brettanomyces naardenensis]